jgi:hypothetical protein
MVVNTKDVWSYSMRRKALRHIGTEFSGYRFFPTSALKKEPACSSETSLYTHQATLRHISEYRVLITHTLMEKFNTKFSVCGECTTFQLWQDEA